MKHEIDLFSTEGMGFVFMGVALVAGLYLINKAMMREHDRTPSGAIGVRG